MVLFDNGVHHGVHDNIVNQYGKWVPKVYLNLEMEGIGCPRLGAYHNCEALVQV